MRQPEPVQRDQQPRSHLTRHVVRCRDERVGGRHVGRAARQCPQRRHILVTQRDVGERGDHRHDGQPAFGRQPGGRALRPGQRPARVGAGQVRLVQHHHGGHRAIPKRPLVLGLERLGDDPHVRVGAVHVGRDHEPGTGERGGDLASAHPLPAGHRYPDSSAHATLDGAQPPVARLRRIPRQHISEDVPPPVRAGKCPAHAQESSHHGWTTPDTFFRARSGARRTGYQRVGMVGNCWVSICNTMQGVRR